jgi:hypothetical protein
MSYPMPCYVIPCHAMPRHAMSCHPMQCHAMPCHALPCYVMSCYAMLRHSRFLQPLRLKQCLTEFSEFNEQTSSNTVYLLWICHSSLVGVAKLFRSRLNLPVRRRLLRSVVPTQKIRQHKHSCRYLALVSALAHYLVAVEELARSFLAYL